MKMTKQKKLIASVAGLAILFGSWAVVDHIRFVQTDNAQLEAHTIMLAARVSGYITDVKVNEGQKVKKGEVLVEIDSRDYANTLKQSQGELAGIEARMKDAQKNYARISQLYSGGVVSSQQKDTVTATYSEVKAKYEAVQAQVAQAQINLENTQIKAPNDGFIAKKSVEQGQLASPGVPLIGFVEAGERWVTANFKETDVSNIHMGAEAKVSVDAISGKSFKGKVTAISAATGASFTLLPPDNATGNFTKVVQRVPVKIELLDLTEADVEALRAGLSTVVKIYKY